jgi:hypothetical protein
MADAFEVQLHAYVRNIAPLVLEQYSALMCGRMGPQTTPLRVALSMKKCSDNSWNAGSRVEPIQRGLARANPRMLRLGSALLSLSS